MSLVLGDAAVNAAANATCALLNDGYLRLYAGPRPKVADAALMEAHALLAELRFGPQAFSVAVGGIAVATDLVPDRAARDEGKATWFMAVRSDGVTPVYTGSVGTSNADLVLNSVGITIGVAVSVEALSYQQPRSA